MTHFDTDLDMRVSSGDSETIKASAIILACNGYGGNTELMKRFIPEMAHANYCGHAGSMGDAIVGVN